MEDVTSGQMVDVDHFHNLELSERLFHSWNGKSTNKPFALFFELLRNQIKLLTKTRNGFPRKDEHDGVRSNYSFLEKTVRNQTVRKALQS